MERLFKRAVAIGLFATLSGCAAVGSKKSTEFFSTHMGQYALPKTIVTVSVDIAGTLDKDGKFTPLASPVFRLDVQAEHVPDESTRKHVYFYENGFTEDQLCITRDTGGLLSDVYYVATDRTPDILINVAELIARLGRLRAAEEGAGRSTAEAAAGTVFRRVAVQVIDVGGNRENRDRQVSDAKAGLVAQVRNYLALQPKGALGRYASAAIDFDLQSLAKMEPNASGEASPDCDTGICFRSANVRTVGMRISGAAIATAKVAVVDVENTAKIDVTRAFLVEKVTRIQFEKGMLVGVYMKKPSEARVLSELPLAILDRIVSVPINWIGKAFGSALVGTAPNQTKAGNSELQVGSSGSAKPGQINTATTGTVINLEPGGKPADGARACSTTIKP